MAKTNYQTIDDYIDSRGEVESRDVRAICDAIAKAVPDAEQVISYQIPAFRLHGWIFYISAHKEHYTLSCPPPTRVFDAFRRELSRYAKTGTSTAVKLPKDEPLPLALIAKMAAWQARHNLAAISKRPRRA